MLSMEILTLFGVNCTLLSKFSGRAWESDKLYTTYDFTMDLNAKTVVYKKTHVGGIRIPEEESLRYLVDYNTRKMFVMNSDSSICTQSRLPRNELPLPPNMFPSDSIMETRGPMRIKPEEPRYFQGIYKSKKYQMKVQIDGYILLGHCPISIQMELKGRSKGLHFYHKPTEHWQHVEFPRYKCRPE